MRVLPVGGCFDRDARIPRRPPPPPSRRSGRCAPLGPPTHPGFPFSVGGYAPHAPVGHGARGADSRAAARPVRGRLRPSRPRRARRTRRGFEGSRASCPGEAAPLTLPAGPAPAARVQGEPRVLSAGGCASHPPRRARRTRRGFGAIACIARAAVCQAPHRKTVRERCLSVRPSRPVRRADRAPRGVAARAFHRPLAPSRGLEGLAASGPRPRPSPWAKGFDSS